MRVFRRSKFQRHLVLPLMLTCFLSGCYKWSGQPTPAYFDAAPERARITLSEGRVVDPRSVEIRGDLGRACQQNRCRTRENARSTEPFRRAGDVSWGCPPGFGGSGGREVSVRPVPERIPARARRRQPG